MFPLGLMLKHYFCVVRTGSTRKLYEKKLEEAMENAPVTPLSDKTYYREEGRTLLSLQTLTAAVHCSSLSSWISWSCMIFQAGLHCVSKFSVCHIWLRFKIGDILVVWIMAKVLFYLTVLSYVQVFTFISFALSVNYFLSQTPYL